MYDFDLRTCDSAYDFLLDFFSMSKGQFFDEFFINYNNDFDTFWTDNIARVNEIDLDEIRVFAFHIVGSLDACSEIRHQGLINLQKVLSQDTQLNRFFKCYGVIFDIDRYLMVFKGKEYNLNYNYSTSPENHIESIARRVYSDYCVNGFMKNDNILSYGTNIHERPEFMINLSRAFPELKDMENDWKERSESYKVNFYALINQIHCTSFELNKVQDELTDDEINKIKKWLVSNAIARATDSLFEDLILYIKGEVDIPPEQIISCDRI